MHKTDLLSYSAPYVQKEKEKIKKSDLSGLKALFIWSVMNQP